MNLRHPVSNTYIHTYTLPSTEIHVRKGPPLAISLNSPPINTFTQMCTYNNMYICKYVYIHTYNHIREGSPLMYVYIHIYSYIRTQLRRLSIHTYTRLHTYIHIRKGSPLIHIYILLMSTFKVRGDSSFILTSHLTNTLIFAKDFLFQNPFS